MLKNKWKRFKHPHIINTNRLKINHLHTDHFEIKMIFSFFKLQGLFRLAVMPCPVHLFCKRKNKRDQKGSRLRGWQTKGKRRKKKKKKKTTEKRNWLLSLVIFLFLQEFHILNCFNYITAFRHSLAWSVHMDFTAAPI